MRSGGDCPSSRASRLKQRPRIRWRRASSSTRHLGHGEAPDQRRQLPGPLSGSQPVSTPSASRRDGTAPDQVRDMVEAAEWRTATPSNRLLLATSAVTPAASGGLSMMTCVAARCRDRWHSETPPPTRTGRPVARRKRRSGCPRRVLGHRNAAPGHHDERAQHQGLLKACHRGGADGVRAHVKRTKSWASLTGSLA